MTLTDKLAIQIAMDGMKSNIEQKKGASKLGADIGIAYDSWESKWLRTGVQNLEKDEIAWEVKRKLNSFGYSW